MGVAVVRRSWTIDETVADEVASCATAEGRSESQMASRLLRAGLDVVALAREPLPSPVSVPAKLDESVPEALGEEDLGLSQSSAGSPAPGGAVGSSSPSVEVLGEGDPDGGVGDGLVSPAVGAESSRAVASSPSPSTTAFVSGLLAREPKKGECPRVLSHRKGEFCKICGEMQ